MESGLPITPNRRPAARYPELVEQQFPDSLHRRCFTGTPYVRIGKSLFTAECVRKRFASVLG